MATSRQVIGWITALVWCVGCPGRQPAENAQMLETRILGNAFFNHGGQARIHALNADGSPGAELADPVIVDGDGNFSFNLRGQHGDMLLVVTGGDYVDPLTSQSVSSGDGALHALVYNAAALEDTVIAVNPWSELLFRRSSARPGPKEDLVARRALEGVFGDSMTSSVTRVHAVRPKSPLSHTGAEELAYIHQCAWLYLAKSVGEELGVGELGVSVMRLADAIGRTISKAGQVDDAIEVIPGKPRSLVFLRKCSSFPIFVSWLAWHRLHSVCPPCEVPGQA